MSWDHTQVFTSSGTWQYPSPPPRDSLVHIIAVGGGGAGGYGAHGTNGYYTGGGGEAGELKEADVILPDSSNVSVTIGNGGASDNNYYTPDTIAGDTLFGSLLACSKGSNGSGATLSSNGAGGVGNPGADGATGGAGGYSGMSGYGSGGRGQYGTESGATPGGQSGYLSVSWNDAGYAYVMEGE